MSNKQKFLAVLSTMIQPKAPNARRAWRETEKAFEEQTKLFGEFTKEELQEMAAYFMMGAGILASEGGVDLFLEVIMDDIRNAVHAKTCPKCKDKPESEHDSEDAPADAGGNAGPQGGAEFRLYSSLEDLIEAVRGPKKPFN